MGFDNTVTVVGNVTRDPELRFTPSGMAVANFGVAWNKRKKDGEEETSFFDVSCFQKLAENVAESIGKGTRVVIYGTLQQRSWENQEGERRSKVEIIADEVAPSLRWASAEVSRNEFSGGGSQQPAAQSRPVANQSPATAPAPAPTYDIDEEPF